MLLFWRVRVLSLVQMKNVQDLDERHWGLRSGPPLARDTRLNNFNSPARP